MSKFCNSCQWWEGNIFTRVDQEFGICSHPVASTMIVADGETRINENNTVYTSSYFGCIYCEPANRFLIDINKILDE